MKEAPFEIGQKVVCITNQSDYLKKNNDYIVKGTFKSDCCKIWYINVGITDENTERYCPRCKASVRFNNAGFIYHNATWFRAIEENTYENISKELAVLPQDEIPDVKKIKELVN